MSIFWKNRKGENLLEEAVRASRKADSRGIHALSDDTRTAILERAYRDSTPADPLPAVFVPTWKAAATAGFMAVLGTAGLVIPLVVTTGPSGAPSRLIAYKDGADVVFEIRNGDGPHEVRKSTDAERFRAGAVTVENGRFRDLADNGPVLVFYKVD